MSLYDEVNLYVITLYYLGRSSDPQPIEFWYSMYVIFWNRYTNRSIELQLRVVLVFINL